MIHRRHLTHTILPKKGIYVCMQCGNDTEKGIITVNKVSKCLNVKNVVIPLGLK